MGWSSWWLSFLGLNCEMWIVKQFLGLNCELNWVEADGGWDFRTELWIVKWIGLKRMVAWPPLTVSRVKHWDWNVKWNLMAVFLEVKWIGLKRMVPPSHCQPSQALATIAHPVASTAYHQARAQEHLCRVAKCQGYHRWHIFRYLEVNICPSCGIHCLPPSSSTRTPACR